MPVLSLRLVASRYLCGPAALDLTSALPWFLMLRGSSLVPSQLGHWLWLLRLPRTTRLMKQLTLETSATALRVVWSLTVWIGVAHHFACAWFVLGWHTRCILFKHTWLDSSFPPDGRLDFPRLALPECSFSPSTIDVSTLVWVGQSDTPSTAMASDSMGSGAGHVLATDDGRPHWASLYVQCLYWALSTTSSLGYGEGPKAQTDAEFVMSIVCQMVGACLYAAIFGNIAQLIQKIDALGTRYKAQQEKINESVHPSLTTYPPEPCVLSKPGALNSL